MTNAPIISERFRLRTSVGRTYFRGGRILVSFVHFGRDALINAAAQLATEDGSEGPRFIIRAITRVLDLLRSVHVFPAAFRQSKRPRRAPGRSRALK